MPLRGRLAAVLGVLILASVGCRAGGGALFRQYEYEEEMYLSLDGSATMYVNGSIQALNALRGTMFDERPNARLDTAAVRAYFNSPVTRVVRMTSSRRRNRRFVHVRIAVDDIRRLSSAPPFSWSSYQLKSTGELVEYKQTVGNPAARTHVGPTLRSGATPELKLGPTAFHSHWNGDELVAFRIHIPSQITAHNAGAGNPRRGNILAWEQPLTDRLNGVPLTLEATMEPKSILYRTLFLFGGTIVAAALMFAVVIWRVTRRGKATRCRKAHA